VSAPAAGDVVEIATRSADETRELGRRLAALLRPGDVVVLSGELGAGKTTLAQGIGAGLGVRGDVTSPTFVISRVHPSLHSGPPLVHVDAYRLHGGAELDDLDLDETLELAVTLVEWGDGLADTLSPDRLRIHLRRQQASDVQEPSDELRAITVEAVGERWRSGQEHARLAALATPYVGGEPQA
jgi:tRNA threonylcarbamoyladenosine biosynthesis protein TsaE